ncbi:hypothetical protein HDC90_000475 [Pedobacter sp. AK013]|uniref:hypothetical protein n=1 Tax=Pedobacter sp. AK013 TaxID=2723071 RepID=UPI001618E8F8|nr:hypothetical protein [Pedobacter sp. AK013]MBB6235875.1 hypothetical protein [Pedobacter sp. AK013]
MKTSFLPLLCLCFAMATFAQKNTFGIVGYTVPSGYELAKHDNVLTYYKEDKSTGAYCNIFIYNVMPGQGGVSQDFDYAWSNLVQKPFKVTGAANMQPEAALKGWIFLLGTAKYNDNGVATLAILINFSGESKMQGICILSNSDQYKTDIESFIASVDVTRATATNNSDNVLSNTKENTPKVNSINTNSQSVNNNIVKGPKPEVWMKSKSEYDMTKGMSVTKNDLMIIYPDGKYYPFMPVEGYAGFYNKNKSWGKAVWNGDRLNVTEPISNNQNYFDKKSATRMQINTDSKPHYYKSKPVDGLRIEGAYTEYASLIPSTNNEIQSLIWFYKDGSFDDRGLHVVNVNKPNEFPAFAPGKGKYKIEDYSMFLMYNDGRVRQFGFSGYLDSDPATVTDVYFIYHNIFYRRDKGYNSNLKNLGMQAPITIK